jgi:hypothetical protein
MPPPDEQFVPPQDVERGRLEMEREWQLRQENVLPLETAWNEGKFYGRALKGSQPLTGVQRVGLFLIGIQTIGVAGVILLLGWPFPEFVPSVESAYERLPDVSLVRIPFLFLAIVVGVRFCWVALKRPVRR